jgi:hypothetical protein
MPATLPSSVLSRRALNRATLARQMLLERVEMPALEVVSHLVGMQAQAPNAPYVALWSRLAGFRHQELGDAVRERRAVRLPLMRTTLHLVTDVDALRLRPLMQSMLESRFGSSVFSKPLTGMELDEVVAAGRILLEETPLTTAALGRRLAERWPDRDPVALAHAVRTIAPLVQLPPRGIWGESRPVTWTTVERGLGRPLDLDYPLETMVLRYLAAFGPASVRDIQAWCWLTRLNAVVDRLRPQLVTFRDETGRELFDLPDAPRPDPDTPAPPRFLPEYDNLLLSHADRTRFAPVGWKPPIPPGNGGVMGTFLVDGMVGGTWRIVKEKEGGARLRIEPYEELGVRDRDEVEKEGERLLEFAVEGVGRQDVEVLPPDGK